MKKTLFLFVAGCLCFAGFAQNTPSTTNKNQTKTTATKKTYVAPKLKNALDSVSYALATLYAAGIKGQAGDDLNYELFASVLKDALTGSINDSTALFNRQTSELLVKKFAAEKAARDKEKAMAEGKKFLEDNLKQPGVVQTSSGLQYKVLAQGTGTTKPSVTDRVKVNYTGKLINGYVFDASTYTFACNEVIRGWTEGLQLMTEGSKFMFYIPSDLGYGMNPPPNSGITPGAVLIFEVELVEINPAN